MKKITLEVQRRTEDGDYQYQQMEFDPNQITSLHHLDQKTTMFFDQERQLNFITNMQITDFAQHVKENKSISLLRKIKEHPEPIFVGVFLGVIASILLW